MPKSEAQLETLAKYALGLSWQPELQSVKTIQESGLATNARGLVLRFQDGTEFQLIIVRTK